MKLFKNKIVFLLILVFVLSACASPVPSTNKGAKKPDANTKKTDKPATGQNISGEIGKTITEQLAAQSKIKKFASQEELKEFMESAEESFNSYIYSTRGMGMMEDSLMAVDFEAAPGALMQKTEALGVPMGDGGGSDDFSETNVQVEGVDEADIIKTDGKYIYAVVKNSLFIINAHPAANAEILAKIEFKSRPQDIYINEDRLVIYGNNAHIREIEPYLRWQRHSPYTFLKIFDISDRKNPMQIKDLDFEGSYTNSRMIGDFVYFVTTHNNYYYIENEPILPRILEGGEEIAQDCAGDKAGCVIPDIYYFDIPYNSYNFTSVASINVKDLAKEMEREVYLMTGNQNMYVSLNNIYITYTKYISEYQLIAEVMKEMIFPRLSQKDQDKIIGIESVENYILSKSEKMNKINQIIERYRYTLTPEEQSELEKETEAAMKAKYKNLAEELEKTVIHKVAINKGELEYQTNGEVTGHVLNQFSMDERDGYFRIATTKNRTWSRFEEENQESYSNVFVLDKDLKTVGALKNLAEGERIYSARFMQGRVYLVTFKQVDPLFVIDLTDPKKPTVLGELKIPGFSNYLHPYDDDTLIGIGKDTGETEWGGVRTKGLKLSLFDVSDVTKPSEIDTYIMGDAGSDSIALHDHKAFLFDKDKELIAIPVSIREDLGNRNQRKLTFSGAAVLKVTKDGFELKGKIDHSDGGKISNRDYWGGYNYYDNTVKRCLYIDDVLYTLSNRYLLMNDLDDLELVKKLRMEKNSSGEDDDFEVVN